MASPLTVNPVQDCYLVSTAPTTPYNTSTLWLGGFFSAVKYRTLLEFNISSIPAGQVIDAASTLKLYVTTNTTAVSGKAHRLTQTGWLEAQATWNDYSTGNAWASGGGDYSGADYAAYTTPGATGWWTALTGADLAALLQKFYDDYSGAVHLLMRHDTEVAHAYVQMWSSEGDYPPVLDVVYAPAPAARRYWVC